jgi:flagellar hook-associated protein 3 FlgL
MSNSIQPISGNYNTLSELLVVGSMNTNNELTTLEEQSSSGYVAQTYGGIGAASSTIFNLNPEINQIGTYQSNINSATNNMSISQTALSQIASIAQTFYADLPDINDTSSNEIASVAANAKSALSQVASLLDTTNGSDYIFSGQDGSNPPIANPDAITSTGMYTQISSAVSNLSTLGASGVLSAALSAASSDATGTTPFSTYLSQSGQTAPTSVQVGANQWVQTGVLANTNTLATSSGSNTTGSYMRDLLMSLSVLGSLTSSQASDPGLSDLVTGLQSTMSGAISAMSTEQGVLGDSQTDLTTQASNYTDLTTSLTSQVSNVQDVNMASVATQLQSVQTQLTASYQLIANLKSLSLTNYL